MRWKTTTTTNPAMAKANHPAEAVNYARQSERLDFGRLPERDYFLAQELERLGEGFADRQGFLTEMALDPPQASSDWTAATERAWVADGVEPVTYANLHRRVEGVARTLIEHGVTSGDRVLLCAPNSADWIAGGSRKNGCHRNAISTSGGSRPSPPPTSPTPATTPSCDSSSCRS